MLEDEVSVWSEPAQNPSLSSREGDLVSIAIDVDARYLEPLLEALANVGFPINPQIYHDAVIRHLYPDGRQFDRPVTLVEFPAYAGRVDEVRRALGSHGFKPDSMHVSRMLDSMHSETLLESAPPGSAYLSRSFLKRRIAAAGDARSAA
jgi:hypothetical protein